MMPLDSVISKALTQVATYVEDSLVATSEHLAREAPVHVPETKPAPLDVVYEAGLGALFADTVDHAFRPSVQDQSDLAEPNTTSIFTMDSATIQQNAFDYFKDRFKHEMAHFKAALPETGVYRLADYSDSLPSWLQNVDHELHFALQWHEDSPELVFFYPKNHAEGTQVAPVVNSDDGRIYLVSRPDPGASFIQSSNFHTQELPTISVSQWQTKHSDQWGSSVIENRDLTLANEEIAPETDVLLMGGAFLGAESLKNGIRITPGIPLHSALFQGALGLGIFLGVHQAVGASALPEPIQPFAELGGVVATYGVLDSGSGVLMEYGLINNKLFPDGIKWGSLVQSAPFLVVGSIGVSAAYDAMGLEMGTDQNMYATVGTMAFGVGAVSHTTQLLAQASVAVEDSPFALRYPQVMAFAEASPVLTRIASQLSSAYASSVGVGLTPMTLSGGTTLSTAGGGVYVAGGGLAGGSGLLGVAFQATGAAGAVLLGSWVGGSIVDTVSWAQGYDQDGDYQLIDFTWNYMNQQAGGKIGGLCDPVLRGIQSVFIQDEVYEGMEVTWSNWATELNDWGDNVEQSLFAMALASVVYEKHADGVKSLRFRSDMLASGVRGFYRKPEHQQILENSYTMAKRFSQSSQSAYLKSAGRVTSMITQSGSYDQAKMNQFLQVRLNELQAKGRLRPLVVRALRDTEKKYSERMIALGLAELDSSGQLKKISLEPSEMNEAQINFIYGGRANYQAYLNQQISGPDQVESEGILWAQRMDALKQISQGAQDQMPIFWDYHQYNNG